MLTRRPMAPLPAPCIDAPREPARCRCRGHGSIRLRTTRSLLALVLLSGCSAPAPPALWSGEAWPAADVLFRRDPRWRGGDGACSVDLGEGRRLWLFGDSFVARPGADGRAGCAMPRNTGALQRGADPETATMEFAWGGSAADPTSWLPDDGDVWHWPLSALAQDGAVTVFCTRVRATGAEGPFGFRAVGWQAFRCRRTAGPLADWEWERLADFATPFPVVVGTASLRHGSHVYAWALAEPGDHAVMLVRWEGTAFARGDLGRAQWHDAGTWRAAAAQRTAPAPVLAEGAPEFSVHRVGGTFVMVQSLGFGATDLAVRTAPRPEGPWSAPRVVFHPPESDRDGVFVYAGKAHAGLGGVDLAATYASNAWSFAEVVRAVDLYYPRFVRLR